MPDYTSDDFICQGENSDLCGYITDQFICGNFDAFSGSDCYWDPDNGECSGVTTCEKYFEFVQACPPPCEFIDPSTTDYGGRLRFRIYKDLPGINRYGQYFHTVDYNSFVEDTGIITPDNLDDLFATVDSDNTIFRYDNINSAYSWHADNKIKFESYGRKFDHNAPEAECCRNITGMEHKIFIKYVSEEDFASLNSYDEFHNYFLNVDPAIHQTPGSQNGTCCYDCNYSCYYYNEYGGGALFNAGDFGSWTGWLENFNGEESWGSDASGGLYGTSPGWSYMAKRLYQDGVTKIIDDTTIENVIESRSLWKDYMVDGTGYIVVSQYGWFEGADGVEGGWAYNHRHYNAFAVPMSTIRDIWISGQDTTVEVGMQKLYGIGDSNIMNSAGTYNTYTNDCDAYNPQMLECSNWGPDGDYLAGDGQCTEDATPGAMGGRCAMRFRFEPTDITDLDLEAYNYSYWYNLGNRKISDILTETFWVDSSEDFAGYNILFPSGSEPLGDDEDPEPISLMVPNGYNCYEPNMTTHCECNCFTDWTYTSTTGWVDVTDDWSCSVDEDCIDDCVDYCGYTTPPVGGNCADNFNNPFGNDEVNGVPGLPNLGDRQFMPNHVFTDWRPIPHVFIGDEDKPEEGVYVQKYYDFLDPERQYASAPNNVNLMFYIANNDNVNIINYINYYDSVYKNYLIQDTIIANTNARRGRISGCTDSEALNYNSEATEDDGTCVYPGGFGFDENPVTESQKPLVAGETIVDSLLNHYPEEPWVNLDASCTSAKWKLTYWFMQPLTMFVTNWNFDENNDDDWETFNFPGDPSQVSFLRTNYNTFHEKDVIKLPVQGEGESGFNVLSHQYNTPGIKVIKAVVLSHITNTSGDHMPLVVKALTIKINLTLDTVYIEEFTETGGPDFKFLPYSSTTPVISGITETSNYYKSLIKLDNSGNFTEDDQIDRVNLDKALENREIGDYIGSSGIEQVRLFKTGKFDIPTLLGIESHYENYVNIKNDNDFNPYHEFWYWDGFNHKYPEETSIGSIFIDDVVHPPNIKRECEIELNMGESDGRVVVDTSGNGNKGILIGDYKLSKPNDIVPVRRESQMKLPKIVDDEKKAL